MATATDPNKDRGAEIVGPRLTVYNLLPYFLDPDTTEATICRIHDLRPEQVAAARAYVFRNLETVLANHLRIEERNAAGNPPEVIEQAEKTRVLLMRFKEWLAQEDREEEALRSAEASEPAGQSGSERLLTFRQWLAEQESRPGEGS